MQRKRMVQGQGIVAALGRHSKHAARRVDGVRVEAAGRRVLKARTETHFSTLGITQFFLYTLSITSVDVVVIVDTTIVRFG